MTWDNQGPQVGTVDAWLHEGIAAVRAGQHERARELLIRVVARDEQNVQAWLWLSGVVDDLEDRRECLENVLRIDPGNAAARRGLDWVRQQTQQAVQESPVSTGSAGITSASPTGTSSSPLIPSTAVVPSDQLEDRPPVGMRSAVTTVSPVPTRDEFSDECGCPYCAAETEPDDRRCGACGKDLWVTFRKQEKRSTLLWVLIGMQLFNTMVLLAIPLLIFFLGQSVLDQLNAFSETPVDVPSGMITIIALLASLPGLLSGLIAAGLFFRWRIFYWLFVVDAVMGVVYSVLAMATLDPISGIMGLVFSLSRLGMIFQVGGDFELDRRRILLRTDRGLKSGVEFLSRADFYNSQKMWALAVVHLRAALALMPDRSDCYLGLAVAYIRLKRYALVDRALEQAKRINPSEPRIAQLESLVNEMRAGSVAPL